jgi:dipeptidyl aminopeptidase/acylaminoacyl peptidase
VCFSPDGGRLASASWGYDEQKKQPYGEVRVWDAKTGQELLTLKEHTREVLSVCFSPDGSRLATASGEYRKPGKVQVWDAQTGQEALMLRGHTKGVTGVCFSPDGSRLASASMDQTVKVWDARTGQELLTTKGHAGAISCVCFSPDGGRLASASGDGTVRVWDAQTGQEALTLRGHTGQISSVCFSPDGSRLASASGGLGPPGGQPGEVTVWDAKMGQEVPSGFLQNNQAQSLATEQNDLAWSLATNADEKERDPHRAVELAREAVKWGPKEGTFWNTLGVTQYRAGDWKAAIEALKRSMELRNGGDSFDWFFLAMAHWQLGEKERARQRFDQAVQWMEKNQPQNEELRRFRAEAEQLLGTKGEKR